MTATPLHLGMWRTVTSSPFLRVQRSTQVLSVRESGPAPARAGAGTRLASARNARPARVGRASRWITVILLGSETGCGYGGECERRFYGLALAPRILNRARRGAPLD